MVYARDMKHNKVLIYSVGALLLAALGYFIGSQFAHYTDRHSAVVTTDTERQDTHAAHTLVTDHTLHTDITDERSFLEAMVPHHDEAVRAGLEVLARGATTNDIRTLVTGIVSAQENEITSMQRWYEEWYGEPLPTVDYTPMMRDLSALSGTALDRAFLEDMIAHHEGAIAMAKSAQPYIERPVLAMLAEDIITTQQAEIEIIKRLLETIE
jgi:uncharacterized protein (DUF305 family)